MAYNVPNYTTDKLSFGPGRLFVGNYTQATSAGVTPTTDVGAVRSGAELAITRERLEVFQGSPQQLIKQYVTKEGVQLTVNGMEWDMNNLAYALGQDTILTGDNLLSGYVAGVGGTMRFGGSMEIRLCSVRLVHRTPAGGTVDVKIWKAQGTGEVTVTFGDDMHEIPYVFRALDPSHSGAATSWSGMLLPVTGNLLEIRHVVANSG